MRVLPRILAGLQRLSRLQHLCCKVTPAGSLVLVVRVSKTNPKTRRAGSRTGQGVAEFALSAYSEPAPLSAQGLQLQILKPLFVPLIGSLQGSRMNPLARPCSNGFSARRGQPSLTLGEELPEAVNHVFRP
jgi:hypothetical protein